MDLLTRSLIAIAIVLAGVTAFLAWNGWQLSRLRRRGAARLLGLEGLHTGRPAILYFTSPDCVPCRTTQRPALERLRAEFPGGLQVLEVDASARPAVADYWGVLSVPTTFVLDAAGQPRRVNHGVASAAKLRQQLEEVGAGTSSPGRGHTEPSALRLEP